MADKVQLNMRISPDRKARWEQAVEESNEANTLTQFIRRAVEREIAGAHEPIETTGTDDEMMQEVLDSIQSIESDLNSLGTLIRNVSDAIDRPDDRNARTEVFSMVPEGEENAVSIQEISDELPEPFDLETVGGHLVVMRQSGIVAETDGGRFYRVE